MRRFGHIGKAAESGFGEIYWRWDQHFKSLNFGWVSSIDQWAYRTTGVDLSATLNEAFNSAASQMREAAEMMVDFGAGAIDGAIDTVTLGFDVVPDIGPVYGHQGAYLAGNVTGSVATGVGIGMISGGAGGFLACTSRLRTAAQLYTALDTGVGVARAGHNIATTGKVGLGDALALAPGAGHLIGKTGQKLGILSNNCFVAGTQVMTGDAMLGSISGVNIEDIRVDDMVWSRDEDDPDAALELKRVTEVYQSVAYDLQSVSLQSADGNVEQIEATDEHPFYVEGRGWTAAVDLLAGDRVLSMLSNGNDSSSVLVVAANADLKRPDGVAVFNFAVEGNHTYFVTQHSQDGQWAWVHNSCHVNLPISTSKLQHEFKHAPDFGVTGNWNKANGAAFESALVKHIDSASVVKAGTYRGTMQVTHFFDPGTNLWAAADMSKNFVAAWKLSPAQILNLLTNGNIQ